MLYERLLRCYESCKMPVMTVMIYNENIIYTQSYDATKIVLVQEVHPLSIIQLWGGEPFP